MVKIVAYELKSKWDRFVLYWYFPLQSLVFFTKMLGSSVNNFIGIPLNGLFFFLSVKHINKTMSNRSKNLGDSFVLILLFYSLLSCVWTLLGGYPLDCCIESIKIFIIPMMFYFWGRNADNVSNKFYKYFVWTCFAVMAIGLILYFTMPSFYSSYLLQSYQESFMRQGSEATDYYIIDRHRFSSFLSSSYSVCFFSVSSLALVLSSNLKGVKDEVIGSSTYRTSIFYGMVGVFLVSAILCMQRTAMVCGVGIVLFYILYGSVNKNIKIFSTAIVLLGMWFVFFSSNIGNERSSVVNDNLLNRLEEMNFNDAMSERTNQYQFVYNNLDKYLIGTGLGSAGTRAAENGYHAVTDGEFIHLFAELGFLGSFVLIILFSYTLARGFKYFKVYNGELMIILFFLISCIGANALSVNLWAGIFWYSLGRIWNQKYLYNSKMKCYAVNR